MKIIKVANLSLGDVIDFTKIKKNVCWNAKHIHNRIQTAPCFWCQQYGLVMNDGELFIHKMTVEKDMDLDVFEFCSAPDSVIEEVQKMERMLNAHLIPDTRKFSKESVSIIRKKGWKLHDRF